MNNSYWRMSSQRPNFAPLRQSIDTQVTIIGGGMAGLLCAYMLKQKGIDAVVLEANEIGSGVTGNTTAKITAQHRLIYSDLINAFGEDAAKHYAQFNLKAIEQFAQIIQDHKIDCDFERESAFVYARNPNQAKKVENEFEAAQKLQIPSAITEQTELPFPIECALEFQNQAQFHPLKFLYALSKQLTIYEHSRVKEIKNGTVYTDAGQVNTQSIIFCTHYPFVNTPGYYFLKMYQSRSYVLALQKTEPINAMFIDSDQNGYSLRQYQDLLLFGGAGHHTGEQGDQSHYRRLWEAAKRYYPNAKILTQWSAQDCITPDGVPYIGKYTAQGGDWYVATGFNKWGMTGSMTAAMILSDHIQSQKEEPRVFSPQRLDILLSAPHFLEESKNLAHGFVVNKLKLPMKKADDVLRGTGEIIRHKNRVVGAYRDNNNQLFLVDLTCPHLGCSLSWNQDEKSWDCPCHGSRFDYQGRLLTGPAQKNLRRMKP